MVGETLGRYRIVSRLAVGGMADIWLATRTMSDGRERQIVLKTMLPALATSHELSKLFENEAAIGFRLRHSNLVRTLDYSWLERKYIAMEFINGLTLRQMGRRLHEMGRAFPQRLLLMVLINVCRGLQAAHELRDDHGLLEFVHRDVSPENIMVTASGVTKVIDFGAAILQRTSSVNTRFVGRVRYAAPERIEGRTEDHRADIYAVGTILYEYLTSTPPYDYADLTMGSRLDEAAIAAGPGTGLLHELARITRKALAVNPDERFATAAALASDLLPLIELEELAPSREQCRQLMRQLFATRATDDDGPTPVEDPAGKTVEMEPGALAKLLSSKQQETESAARLAPRTPASLPLVAEPARPASLAPDLSAWAPAVETAPLEVAESEEEPSFEPLFTAEAIESSAGGESLTPTPFVPDEWSDEDLFMVGRRSGDRTPGPLEPEQPAQAQALLADPSSEMVRFSDEWPLSVASPVAVSGETGPIETDAAELAYLETAPLEMPSIDVSRAEAEIEAAPVEAARAEAADVVAPAWLFEPRSQRQVTIASGIFPAITPERTGTSWFDVAAYAQSRDLPAPPPPASAWSAEKRSAFGRPRPPVSEAVQCFDRGLALLQDKLVASALAQWERALELDPNNRTYQVNVNRLRQRMTRDDPGSRRER